MKLHFVVTRLVIYIVCKQFLVVVLNADLHHQTNNVFLYVFVK